MTVLPFVEPGDVLAAIPVVTRHLAAGGLVAYPTETVYGLGSRPKPIEVAALAALKGREPGKPFLLLVASWQMISAYGLVFTTAAEALGRAFWPGPLTLVLKGGEAELPDTLRGPEGGIAVRWTSHSGLGRLIAALGYPLTSTSANRPKGATAPGAATVVSLFQEAVARGILLVLDGGVLGNVPPSTLVDCTADIPRLIREGAIPRTELRARVGRLAP